MKDPGTIYSDDEVENFSDDDDEFEKEMALQRISVKDDGGDGFFDDLPDESMNLKKTKKPVESSIDKYLKKSTNAYDINNTIDRVRLEDKKYFSDEDDDDDKDITPNENESYTIKESEVLKLKNNLKKKEKKKERVEKSLAEKMEKEKEEFCFEDAPTVTSDISFLEMNLSPPLLKAIANMGYENPTPIQASTIPIALKGRDICGCAATGTGKTAAFMLPIVQRLIFKPSTEEVTRVLVYEVTEGICEFTDVTVSLSVGGFNRGTQTKELMDNPDIIIATPGRLIDHLHNTPDFNLKDIEVLVLDEADRMLDKFFIEQLTEIVRQCSFTRQTMLFSATMTDKVKDLVVVSLKSPVRVFVNNNTEVAQNLRQEFIRLKVKNDENRLAVLAHLLMNNFKEETIVFVQQKYECHRMHIIFGLMGLKCGELHGNLKQQKRLEYLKKFKDKEVHILFATDVAARGLDIKGVKTVINYTVPVSYEMYVHRVGRTARAGFSGRSITISYDSGEDFTMLRKIQKNSFAPLSNFALCGKAEKT
ncbi:putative ATP-dependent RNA helicase DDX27 [Armadillidium nasatum]|uniref:RNA helicase n=1 Tax=Armadillidium nasatum TaxID=96803 RepID=A0A5N5T7R2_9CRUS|nr:putative ATP-dependent RNA helicase DDX27 [Armadillidium nasatum]